jgi:hypothetical protein
MRIYLLRALILLIALRAAAAERQFDFTDVPEGKVPPGFRSAVSGQGKPGDWKILLDDVPPLMPPVTHLVAPPATKKSVLAQTAQDSTDSHYPLLVFEDETYGDFTLTTRFKIVSGNAEQMAGVAFRIQDEKNYYYVRASALGNTFYFFKFVNGELIGPIGSKVPISKGVWHDLGVECKGSLITCLLDGKPIISEMLQQDFARGKIGFWTKSDSVSYFSDTKINYTPIEVPAEVMVRNTLKGYPVLQGLRIAILSEDRKTTRVIGSNQKTDVGHPGVQAEFEVINKGIVYYGKERNSVIVTLPLRDRNGDVIGAVRATMKTFTGQTEENAVLRALPIAKAIQNKVRDQRDLLE